ncbi:MAG: MFS transporter [bacterium]|nr:MFS transporter [Gammaproteobacteria bacterium]HIL96099.1 MFS transporter [Pseudomonadales bacterium]
MSVSSWKHLTLRWEFTIVGSMCLGYAALMLCRTTLGVAGPAMLMDADLHLNKTAFGAILGWGTAGNLLGKLTNGILADKAGGQKIFVLAIVVAVIATFMFGTMSSITAFCGFYFLTIFAKSAGWPSMANIIKVWFTHPAHGRIWGIIATSSRASSVAATLLLGSLLLLMSWRGLFFAAAIVAAVIVAVLIKFLRGARADVGKPSAESQKTLRLLSNWTKNHPLNDLESSAALIFFFGSARFWLISVAVMSLAILFEFQVFIPIYLSESFDLMPAEAGIASSVFPLGCLIAVFTGGFIFDRLSKKSLIFASGALLVLAVSCLLLLWSLAHINLNPQLALMLTMSTIFVFGFAISPVYYLPMSVFSIDFGGKHCGLLVGLIDAIAYSGTMVFDFVGGSVADQADGWQSFLLILIATSIVATFSMVAFLYLDFRGASTAKFGMTSARM